MIENRVLGKRKEVTGKWSKLHNGGFLTLTKSYSSDRIKTDKRGEALARIVQKRNAYINMVTKPAGKNRSVDLGIYGRTTLALTLKK